MKNAERIVIVTIILFLIGGAAWGYYAVTDTRSDFRERVAAGEFEIRDEPAAAATSTPRTEVEWRKYYPVTYEMRVGDVTVQASVADTLSKRITGLSNTPYLPAGVVKLFAFGVPGSHSIWMKDMNYPIDIIWADEDGLIVHIEENVSPDSYDRTAPQNSISYRSPVPSWFVVETNAGFVEMHEITLGDRVTIPRGN